MEFCGCGYMQVSCAIKQISQLVGLTLPSRGMWGRWKATCHANACYFVSHHNYLLIIYQCTFFAFSSFLHAFGKAVLEIFSWVLSYKSLRTPDIKVYFWSAFINISSALSNQESLSCLWGTWRNDWEMTLNKAIKGERTVQSGFLQDEKLTFMERCKIEK